MHRTENPLPLLELILYTPESVEFNCRIRESLDSSEEDQKYALEPRLWKLPPVERPPAGRAVNPLELSSSHQPV